MGKYCKKSIYSTSREVVITTNQYIGFRKLCIKSIHLENSILYNLLKIQSELFINYELIQRCIFYKSYIDLNYRQHHDSLKVLSGHYWELCLQCLRALTTWIIYISGKMSIAHPTQILDYVSYQLKLVRSDTYKFFQNWLRVFTMLIKSISIVLKYNCFMILMIICEYFNFPYLIYCLNGRFNIDLITCKNSILCK